MVYVLVQHTVSDYRTFKPVFEDDGQRRKRLGSKGGCLLRLVHNPQEYMALFQWDDLDKARAFATSFELREAVEWAGVVGSARMTVLEEVETVSA